MQEEMQLLQTSNCSLECQAYTLRSETRSKSLTLVDRCTAEFATGRGRGSSYRVETDLLTLFIFSLYYLPNEQMLAASCEKTLHQAPLVRLTTSLAARIGDRRPIKVPNGKQNPARAASTENQTVSRRVFSWSKKPIGLCAAARDAHELPHSTTFKSQRPTTTHDG